MDKVSFNSKNIFGIGEVNEKYAKYFTGTSYLKPLTTVSSAHISNVTFTPSCRNYWHIHNASAGGGQVLLCVAGYGWYKEEGGEARLLKEGDVVEVKVGVKHWHGAAKNSWFSHLALECPGENCSTIWQEEVEDSEYNLLPSAPIIEDFSTKKQTAGKDKLGSFAPEFAHFNDDILFGEVWSRSNLLSAHDRSLITISALMGQGTVDSSLKSHLLMGKSHGITRDEIVEVVTQLAFYVGWPRAWAVFPLVKEVYEA